MQAKKLPRVYLAGDSWGLGALPPNCLIGSCSHRQPVRSPGEQLQAVGEVEQYSLELVPHAPHGPHKSLEATEEVHRVLFNDVA